MSRFNRTDVPQVGPKSPVATTGERVVGHEGFEGWGRESKSELYVLAVSFMGGDDNFYEKSEDRYLRIRSAVQRPEVYTDTEWLYGFIAWLRNVAGMRTVAMVIAVEAVKARLEANLVEPVLLKDDVTGIPVGNRDLISIACSRADEPAEIMAYWLSTHGKQIPWPIRNGIADAAVRLYNEFSILKYGFRSSAAVSARDVLRMCHPKAKDFKQSALLRYVARGDLDPLLALICARQSFNGVARESRVEFWNGLSSEQRVAMVRDAGVTWEVLSEWSPEGMTGEMWDAMIPNMGLMALMRNLRNFDKAGINTESVTSIRSRFMSREQIQKSKILPYRWYQAYRSVESVRWSEALDIALTESLFNIPVLYGKTLLLVDMSGSMSYSNVSAGSVITYSDVASLFGSAWKLANVMGVDLFQYGTYVEEVSIGNGGSVLQAMKKFHDMGGTNTHSAIAHTFNPRFHNRVVILTDEQAFSTRYKELPVPPNVPVYIWNLAGYKSAVMESGRLNRHTFGGLSDDAFKLIPLLEAGTKANWPWE